MKSKKQSIAETVRSKLVHPALIDAFDCDWYWPLELTAEHKSLAGVKRAIKEGWAEWIETEEDIEAIKKGFKFDLSRDNKGRTVYWYKGDWVRWSNKKLVKVDRETIVHVGAGDHATKFAERFLRFTKDPLKGKPYRFIHWQRKLVLTIFGWVRYTEVNSENVHYRRFREVMVEIAKKNSKSDLGSVIAAILIRADHTNKAFVYGAASDRNQGRIIFNETRDYVKQAVQICDEIEIIDSKSKMVHIESGSTYEVISADAYRNDGYDAHGVLFDELHQQPNRGLFSILKRAGLARPQPLRFVTTTYGKSLSMNTGKLTAGNIWAEEHLKSKSQLEGRRSNYRRLNWIASAEPIPVVITKDCQAGSTVLPVYRLQQPIDVGEVIEIELSNATGTAKATTVKLVAPAKRYQWHIEVEPIELDISAFSQGTANLDALNPDRLEHAIRRANPSVGIILSMEDIRAEITDAVGPMAIAEASQLCLNLIAGGGQKWLSGAAWLNCGRKRILPSSLLGQRCFGGLDASFTNDLTAFWLAFPSWKLGTKFRDLPDQFVRLAGLVWVPEEGIEKREEVEEIPYRAYAEMPYFPGFGFVRICRGSTIDYNQVGEDVVKFCKLFKLQAIGYDPNYSQFIVDPYLVPAGLKCVSHRQGAVSMGPPTKRFENLVKRGMLQHGNHPMLNAAIDGTVLHPPDKVGNTYPSKSKSTSRIDPVMAALMAVGWACDPPKEVSNNGAYSGEVGSGVFD